MGVEVGSVVGAVVAVNAVASDVIGQRVERVLGIDTLTREQVVAFTDGDLPARSIGEDIHHHHVVTDGAIIYPGGVIAQDIAHGGVVEVVVAHRVHVIQAHLAISLMNGFEIPLQVIARNGPSHVSRGAAVMADVAPREDGALPQGTAGGGDVVLSHVGITRGACGVVAVVVAAHDMSLLVLVEQ